MMNKIKGWNWYTKKKAIVVLLISLILTVLFGSLLPQLRMDYQFKKFFPSESDDTQFYSKYQSVFKADNDFLLLTFSPENGVFNVKTLRVLERQIEKVNNLSDVKEVHSIFSEKYAYALGTRLQYLPVLHWDETQMQSDSLRIMQQAEWVGTFISTNGKHLGVLVNHTKGLNPLTGKKLLTELEEIQKNCPKLGMEVSGRIVGEHFYIEKMSQELFLFIGISVFLVFLFLIITFKSFWGVVLPSILLFLVTVWVFGILVISDRPVNVLLVMLPSILFVVTMSDVIHIYNFYLEKIKEGLNRFEAVKDMVKEVGLATFLTSFTTAVGFFTLIFIPVEPVQVFGFFTGLGVMIAYLLTIFVLSALLIVSPIPKTREKSVKDNWTPLLSSLFLWVFRYKKSILIVSGIIIILGSLETRKLNTNAYLMDNVKPEEPLKVQFDFVDKQFGGVRPFELALHLKPGVTLKNEQLLTEIAALETHLESKYGVKIIRSLGLYSKIINRTLHANNPNYFELPEKRDWKMVRRALLSAEKGKIWSTISDSSGNLMRISGLSRDWGSMFTKNMVTEVKNWHKKTFGDSSVLQPQFTGSAFMYDKNMDQLSQSIFLGVLVSILTIAVIVFLLFKSMTAAIISIIPNIIPLLALVIVMTYFHIELKLSTAIVFTIAFGIAVDDTIHYLSRFKIEIKKDVTVFEALRVSFISTGKAMILTTVLLCVGFLSMVFSSFLGTFYMGLMVSVTLAVALIADLTVLPILLLLFYKKKSK